MLLLAFLLLLVFPGLASAAEVTYLVRPVEVKRVGTRQWAPLQVGDEVVEGDSIRTGKGGRVEVTITPKRVFRIGEVSEVTLDSMVLRDTDLAAKFRVILGRIWTSMLKPLRASLGEKLVVQTPTVTLGIKGTRFDVRYDARTRRMETLVLEGQVEANPTERPRGPPREVPGPREIAPPQEITREEWTLLVRADQKLVFVPGRPAVLVPITDEDLAEEWVRFNNTRDAALPEARGRREPRVQAGTRRADTRSRGNQSSWLRSDSISSMIAQSSSRNWIPMRYASSAGRHQRTVP